MPKRRCFAALLLFSVRVPGQTPDANGVYRAGPGIKVPRQIQNSVAKYTDEARRAHVSSLVVIELVVDEEGRATSPRVIRRAGFGLDESALEAVLAARFEPGTKQGVPVKVRATLDTNFRLMDHEREGQIARLSFGIASPRPQLSHGEMPVNPAGNSPAALQISFMVSPEGHPENLKVQQTTNPDWSDKVARQVAGWRFKGLTESKSAVLEVTVGDAVMPKTALQYHTVPEGSGLPAPTLLSPLKNAVFDVFPRVTSLAWEHVPGAIAYFVDCEYHDDDHWTSQMGGGVVVHQPQFNVQFIGAQPGRWRVASIDSSGGIGKPGPWREFRYTR